MTYCMNIIYNGSKGDCMKKIAKRCLLFLLCVGIGIVFLYAWHHRTINYTRVLDSHVQQEEEPIQNLRVATYNVKTLNGGTSLMDFKSDVELINPAIICLQEVDKKAFRSNQMDMAKEMASIIGYEYYYYYPTMWVLDGYYGLAIISKYPISEVSSKQLPTAFFEEPRVLAQASVVVNNKTIQIYNTHLSFRNREDRLRQISFIENNITNENAILMGDFNTFVLDEFFTLPNMKAISNEEYQYITFRDFGFPDNIFYSEPFTLLDVNVQPSSFSDHNILYVDLSL